LIYLGKIVIIETSPVQIVTNRRRCTWNNLLQSFNYTFRYNKNFNFLHLIYPVELVVRDTTDSPNAASYLDLYLEHNIMEPWQPHFMTNVTILMFL